MPVVAFVFFLAWLGKSGADYTILWYVFLAIVLFCGIGSSRNTR